TEDHGGIGKAAREDRYSGSYSKKTDGKGLELVEEDAPPGAGNRFRQKVGAVLGQAPLRGFMRQALSAGGLPLTQNFVLRHAVPGNFGLLVSMRDLRPYFPETRCFFPCLKRRAWFIAPCSQGTAPYRLG